MKHGFSGSEVEVLWPKNSRVVCSDGKRGCERYLKMCYKGDRFAKARVS